MSDCIFCKIIAGEIPSKKCFEDDDIIAFYDIHPAAPVHFLVVSKKHINSLMELEEADAPLVGKMLFKAQEIAKEHGCADKGGRFIINAKKDGGQTIDHLHVHFIGGKTLGLKMC